MAIDPKEIKSIEDSMVHDVDEEPHPEGWGVYLTLRYLSKVVLAVYGFMLFLMLVVQTRLDASQVPFVLRAESVLLILPVVIVAAYLYVTTEHEPELAKKRTWVGKIVTLVIVFVAMQVTAMVTWIGLAKAFSLQ